MSPKTKSRAADAAPRKPTEGRDVAIARIKRILVPMDFSGQSRQALRYAIPLAEKFGARIVLLHVVVPVPVTAPEMALMQTNLVPAKRAAAEQLHGTALKLLPRKLYERSIVSIGHAASEILVVARRIDTDMIVLSTHGRSGLKRFFMGSTAEQVVRHATCPVLSVRRK